MINCVIKIIHLAPPSVLSASEKEETKLNADAQLESTRKKMKWILGEM
jgi:hypothetical protein